jgi:hypothetical protein
MKVAVSAVKANNEIVQLILTPSDELLAEQARVVATCPSQMPFEELHVTLASSPLLHENLPLPAPPSHIELVDAASKVEREDKTSVYLRVSDASQKQLEQYVQAIAAAVNLDLYDAERVFHVSLSNLTGASRGSIAKVWNHTPMPV